MNYQVTSLRQRKMIRLGWDVSRSLAMGAVVVALTIFVLSMLSVVDLRNQSVLICIYGAVASLLVGAVRFLSKRNEVIYQDSTDTFRCTTIRSHKTLQEAFDEVDEKIVEKIKDLRLEYPRAFITSQTYYPSKSGRRHTATALVVATRRF